MKFKMLNGNCVPVTTPDNYFQIAVQEERRQAKLNKIMVLRLQIALKKNSNQDYL